MRGHIRKRSRDSWSIVLDVGTDPATGKRKQVWITVRGTKKQAQERLNDELAKVAKGEFVEPSKRTVGEELDAWFELEVKPTKRPRSVETYRSVIERHLKPAIGGYELQKLTHEHIQRYFNERRKKLSPATLAQHGAILHGALAEAERSNRIHRNPSRLVKHKPKRRQDQEDVIENCWEAEEAKQFLQAAREAGPQPAAFYAAALELGLRKGELCGLRWEDIDLDRGTVRVAQQLAKVGGKDREPLFLTPKNNHIRRVDISPATVAFLVAHRKHQAEIKLRNRTAYHDYGLVFAKEGRVRATDRLGDPLQANNIAEREFDKLIHKAKVRRIKFHGLRHTSATLALQNGVPVKVVQQRLGHRRIEITMDIYAHALPSAKKAAAEKMGSLLHG